MLEPKLKKAIDAASAVSFDVYDTAVLRVVAHPHGVFRLMEPEARRRFKDGGIDFYARRLEAERRAREEARRLRHSGEVTLAEIYEVLGRDFGAEAARLKPVLAALMTHEIEIERKVARVNPSIQEAYRYVIDNGKQVVFTSDMYLPYEVMRDILQAAGYAPSEHRLFLSNLEGVGKREGGLFNILIETLALAPGKILHIGDHPISDVKNAKHAGLAIHPYERCAVVAAAGDEAQVASRTDLEAAPSVWRGLGDARLYHARPADQARAESEFFTRLGYETAGILAAGFAQWLAARAQAEGLERLYFLPETQGLLFPAYRMLHERGMATVAGGELHVWPEGLKKSRARLGGRDALLRHLEESGLFGLRRVGIVELGFGGEMAFDELAELLRMQNPEIDLTGLALADLHAPPKPARHAYLCDGGLPLATSSALQTALPLLAALTYAPRGSLADLDESSGRAEPRYAARAWPDQQNERRKVQEAALHFLKDHLDLARSLPDLPAYTRELAGAPLLDLIEKPSALAATKLGEWRVNLSGRHLEREAPLAALPPWREWANPLAIRESYERAEWKAAWRARALGLTQSWPGLLRKRLLPWL